MITLKKRFEYIIDWFSRQMPVAETELHYNNPYELLVAVILSAQCTDKRINIVTPPLFEAFPTPQTLAETNYDTLFQYVKSVSYPNNKTRNLLGMAKMLVEKFNGEVPDNIEDLMMLPGVGRKTANVMLSVVFNKAAMAVDTHVFRVSERIGLTTNSRNPLQTEKRLMQYIPTELVPKAHHWLILHGRYVCKARRPDCLNCGIKPVCRYYSRTQAKKDNGSCETE